MLSSSIKKGDLSERESSGLVMMGGEILPPTSKPTIQRSFVKSEINTMHDLNENPSKQLSMSKETLQVDFYGVETDIPHFELIYSSICSKINHEVAIKCSYMMARIKSFSLDSSIGKILKEKQTDFKLSYKVPILSDFLMFNLLVKQNLAISVNVRGREEDQKRNVIRPETRMPSSILKGGRLANLDAAYSDFMFVFSLNKEEDEEEGFGRAITLLKLKKPHLQYIHYDQFEAQDSSYINLLPVEMGDSQDEDSASSMYLKNKTIGVCTKCINYVNKITIDENFERVFNSENESDMLSDSESYEQTEVMGRGQNDEFIGGDITTTTTTTNNSVNTSMITNNSTPTIITPNNSSTNRNFQKYDPILQRNELKIMKFEVRFLGNLHKQKLAKYILRILQQSFLELLLESWVQLLFFKDSPELKSKFESIKFMKAVKQISEVQKMPLKGPIKSFKIKLNFRCRAFLVELFKVLYDHLESTLDVLFKDVQVYKEHWLKDEGQDWEKASPLDKSFKMFNEKKQRKRDPKNQFDNQADGVEGEARQNKTPIDNKNHKRTSLDSVNQDCDLDIQSPKNFKKKDKKQEYNACSNSSNNNTPKSVKGGATGGISSQGSGSKNGGSSKTTSNNKDMAPSFEKNGTVYSFMTISGLPLNPNIEPDYVRFQETTSERRTVIEVNPVASKPKEKSLNLPARRSFFVVNFSENEISLQTYNIREDKVYKIIEHIKQQTFYSEICELVILNFATISNFKKVENYRSNKAYSSRFSTNVQSKIGKQDTLAKIRYKSYLVKTEDVLYGLSGGITQLINSVIKNGFSIHQNPDVLKAMKSIKSVKLYIEIAEALNGVIRFMETHSMEEYQCARKVEKLSCKQLQVQASYNFEAHRKLYLKMVKDLRVKSLLTEQVEDKKNCFEIVKDYCETLSEFTIPVYYLERIYHSYNEKVENMPLEDVEDYMITIENVSYFFCLKIRIFKNFTQISRILNSMKTLTGLNSSKKITRKSTQFQIQISSS